MNRISFLGLSSVILCASLNACGGHADASDEAEVPNSPPPSVELNGRTFLRRDLWSDDDFQRVVYEGRAEQPATTPEVLAAQLRAHTLYHGAYYVELEPNLELAKRVLADTSVQGTPPQEPYQGRRVIGPDNRSFYTTANTYPGTTFGFNDTEGTGSVISATTVYTAAHVIYLQGNGFYCQNGTTSPTGSCAASPGWRFGVQGTTGFTNWTTNFCYRETLTNAYISLNSNSDQWDSARWDYAVVDLSGCAPLNTGWLGTWIASDSLLQTMTAYNFGYAERATCPNDAMGQDGKQGVVGSTDCPGTGTWPGSTWQLSSQPNSAPYSGAKLWWSTDAQNSGPGAPGASGTAAAGSISTTTDVTFGNSGGALFYFIAANDRRVVGVASRTGLPPYGGVNIFNRWTGETYNFFMTYSHFPN